MGFENLHAPANEKAPDAWSGISADLTRDQVAGLFHNAQSSFSELNRGNPYHTLTQCALEADIADPQLSHEGRGAAQYLLNNYDWIEGTPPNPDCSKPIDSLNNWDNQSGISTRTLDELELIADNKTGELWTHNIAGIAGAITGVVGVAATGVRLFGLTGGLIAGAAAGALAAMAEGYQLYHQRILNQHLPAK
ncbi:MAG TPA: hypothetical protein V6D22_02915 [Candidatus Obscuribacterales bacterium]